MRSCHVGILESIELAVSLSLVRGRIGREHQPEPLSPSRPRRRQGAGPSAMPSHTAGACHELARGPPESKAQARMMAAWESDSGRGAEATMLVRRGTEWFDVPCVVFGYLLRRTLSCKVKRKQPSAVLPQDSYPVAPSAPPSRSVVMPRATPQPMPGCSPHRNPPSYTVPPRTSPPRTCSTPYSSFPGFPRSPSNTVLARIPTPSPSSSQRGWYARSTGARL